MISEPAPTVQRTDSPFRSQGVTCAAWLYRPATDVPSPSSGAPVIVMAHGFSGVRGMRLDAYAERFAAAGYQVLLFDYRFFGDSEGTPRQLLHIRKQHQDWAAAVAHARSLPGVDPERVILWGTSLSGGHVLATASRDRRISAVVAQVPHVSGVAAAMSVGPVQSVRLTVPAVLDQVGAWLGRRPRYLAAVGLPGELAAMTSPDARPGMDRITAESKLTDGPSEQVAARIILQMAFYSPGRRVRRIGCPVLMQIAEKDVITPTKVADRVARRITDVEIRHYLLGHFDPYVAPAFDGVVAHQLEFLRRVSPVG